MDVRSAVACLLAAGADVSEKPPVLAEKSERVPTWDPKTADQIATRRATHDLWNANARELGRLNEHLRDEKTGCEIVVDAVLGFDPLAGT